MVLAVSALGLARIVVLGGSAAPAEEAQPTVLYVPPIGYEDSELRPTPTPIQPPDTSERITADGARSIAAHVITGIPQDAAVDLEADLEGTLGRIKGGSVAASLEQARDYDVLASLAASYPIWVVTAEGTFRPAFGNASSRFSEARIFLDAMTGSIVRVQLRNQLSEDAGPTPGES